MLQYINVYIHTPMRRKKNSNITEKIMIKHFFKQKKLYKLLFKLDAKDGSVGAKKKRESSLLSAILPSSDSIRVERRITNEI